MAIADRELLTSWTGEPHITRSRRVLLGVEANPAGELGEPRPDPAELTALDLSRQLQKSVEALYKIASYKKGYKGESIRILKEVADVVSAAGKEFASRTQSDESKRLRKANTRLTEEVTDLRRQLQQLREEVTNMAGARKAPVSSPSPTPGPSAVEVVPPLKPQREKRIRGKDGAPGPPSPPPSLVIAATNKRGRWDNGAEDPGLAVPTVASIPGADAIVNAIAGRVVEFVNARFAAIEGRLLPETIRPPLRADKNKGTATGAKSFAEMAATPSKGKAGGGGGGKGNTKPPAASMPAAPKKGGGKQPQRKTGKAPPQRAVNPPKVVKPLQTADGSEWTTVSRKGGKTAGSGGRDAAKTAPSSSKRTPSPPEKGDKGSSGKGRGGKDSQSKGTQPAKPRRIRPPTMAAVLLSTEPPKEGERPVSRGGGRSRRLAPA